VVRNPSSEPNPEGADNVGGEHDAIRGFSAGRSRGRPDAAEDVKADAGGMSHAVVWSQDGGPRNVGKLELDRDSISLIGGLATRLGLCDLVSVAIERRPVGPRSRRPVLVLVDREGTTIELWPLQGLGVLHELADELLDARANVAA
jgi:hypothetical protein